MKTSQSLAVWQQPPPSNADLQRNLSVALGKAGNVLTAQGDLAGAAKAYDEALAISRRLAAADPTNAVLQRDVFVSLWKLATAKADGVRWADVLAQLESMDRKGILLPSDRGALDEARQNAAKEAQP